MQIHRHCPDGAHANPLRKRHWFPMLPRVWVREGKRIVDKPTKEIILNRLIKQLITND